VTETPAKEDVTETPAKGDVVLGASFALAIVKHGDEIPRLKPSGFLAFGGFAGGGGILAAGDSTNAFKSGFSLSGDGGVSFETDRGQNSNSGVSCSSESEASLDVTIAKC
jgi:hypothetical protein